MISIKYPIWKTRSVGIATFAAGLEKTTVEITYRNKAGERLYPHVYSIPTNKLRKYPIQAIKPGVRLYIVPIEDLNIEEFREKN